MTLDLIGQKQGSTDVTANEAGSSEEGAEARIPVKAWKPGDKCMAPYSEDKNYYEATVDEILEDGSCTVTFEEYGNTDVTEISLLKSVEEENKKKRGATGEGGGPEAKKPMSKKDQQAAQREYKRKKSQKKAQRLKQLEEEREAEKNKWLDFNVKVF